MHLRFILALGMLLAGLLTAAQAQDDATADARASLARIQALRAERPGDGVPVYY
jgi:hypothetical protein